MIQLALPMPCGNAVAMLIQPFAGASAWKLLRREDSGFTGHNDPDAVVADEGDGDAMLEVADYTGLVNGTAYFYQLYSYLDNAWLETGLYQSVTPAYTEQTDFHIPDFAGFVRERLSLGLQAELALGHIGHETGAIPVLAAPPQADHVKLPLATVMLESRNAEVRAIGEQLEPDSFSTADDLWSEYEGWLDRSRVQIIGWSLNPDDRKRLREAIQRVLMLNLPVLSVAGFTLPELSESEQADFQSFNAPMYQTIFDLSCQHPSVVRARRTPISTVEVTADVQINRSNTYTLA